nr:ImmA/IrrE family metallo-endopeptidase [Oceanobacillus jordanicus]
MGIVVRHVPLGNILGFHTRQCRVSLIHVNESLSTEQQIFTCSHEMGHAILHPEVSTPFLKSSTYFSNEKIEKEANEFAIELLLSKEVVNPITVQDAIESYRIPKQLLYKKIYP